MSEMISKSELIMLLDCIVAKFFVTGKALRVPLAAAGAKIIFIKVSILAELWSPFRSGLQIRIENNSENNQDSQFVESINRIQ